MMRYVTIALAASAGFALTACQSVPQAVQAKEDLLAAAGFVPQPANTPQRQASMRKLPPNKFVQQVRNNQVVYLYADPIVCQCVYLGDQTAYGQYRQMVFQKSLADERRMTATMAQDSFDFGPWGPWGPVFVY
ncbi:hypothetical protein [Enterovirga rhinocerotis]|uniref:Lipoprotein n=1 Tax=Enterovirga rhinocerotis TaxID=1339210 RepID=A0A4R7C880_9HYPH|nr:hypothetical protein [Enterovirga rhinocerotis]TDR93046.1 hypothetical protein EV668_0294 [Enterovirga rhinocerotis]